MDQEMLKRLEELEKVHTRYQGPVGKPGRDARITLGCVESGDTASARIRQLDGNVYELSFVIPRSKDLDMQRAERNEFREELNNFRRELHDLRAAACMELQQLYDEYAERLADIYSKEADAFCELRDKSCAEIEERMARAEGEVRRNGERSESD